MLEHLQAAALRRLESNLHEEMDTDRIVHFLMMVAGRFTINHEPVGQTSLLPFQTLLQYVYVWREKHNLN